jgi:hypothetical protein
MTRDARDKAEYATRMMHVAYELAGTAPSERQARILARYALIHADSAQRWIHAWHKQLKASTATAATARTANPALRRLRQEFAKQKAVRDKLAAKRQAISDGRAADLQATVALWQSLTSSGVGRLCQATRVACNSLGTTGNLARPAVLLDEARDALSAVSLSQDCVYTDVTSYASGEPNLVAVTVSGPIGRRVMQINDLHDHLEVLNALRELACRTDELGLLLRSALIVEVCALLEQVLGPPRGAASPQDGSPLLVLVDAKRGEQGHEVLEDYATRVVPEETRSNLRDMRNRVAAHLDRQLTLAEIKDTLMAVSVDDLLGCADVTLECLDTAACRHVDLGLLAIGHRRLASVQPAEQPTVPAPFQADGTSELLDSPHMAIVVGGFGAPMSARIAGVVAGRGKSPRERWRDVAPDPA